MAIKIPDSQKKNLVALASLSDADAAALETALGAVAPTMSAKALSAAASPHVSARPETIEGIVRLLLSLFGARDQLSTSNAALVGEVVDKAIEEGLPGLASDQGSAKKLKERLKKLLDLETSLGVGWKARDLFLEQEQPFESARVVTDVRAVFGGSTNTPEPVAAMVYHTLKIAAHGEEGHKTFFFALDSTDVKELRIALERAAQKEVALRAMIQKAGLPIVEVQLD